MQKMRAEETFPVEAYRAYFITYWARRGRGGHNYEEVLVLGDSESDVRFVD